MSSSKKISKKRVIKVVSLLVFSLLISLIAELSYLNYTNKPYHFSSELLPKSEIENKYNIIALGNSHTESAITFEGYAIDGLNMGAVAQRLRYDLARLKHYKAQIAPDAIILINVSPISFSHKINPSDAAFQSGYYDQISPIFIPNLKIGSFIESEFLFFTKAGDHWRKLYAKQVQDRVAAEAGRRFEELKEPEIDENGNLAANTLPSEDQSIVANSQSGMDSEKTSLNNSPLYIPKIKQQLASPSAVPNKLGDSVAFMFNKWYYTDEFDPIYFEENRKDLEKLIRYIKKQGWQPVVITIPISAELQNGLLDDYMQKYLYENIEKTDLQGAEYIDFSQHPGLTKNTLWYSNSDHLNKDGATAFSYVLLETLIEKDYLSPESSAYIPAETSGDSYN